MINVTFMNEKDRKDYIFENQSGQPIVNRFGWLDHALLDDIKTFVNTLQSAPQLVQGGGNLSIPILVCTGLELASSLYVGMTDYLNHSKYNATVNVEKFINDFFPGCARVIPLLVWDGVRMGLTIFSFQSLFSIPSSLFSSLSMEEQNQRQLKPGNLIEIRINSGIIQHTWADNRAIQNQITE